MKQQAPVFLSALLLAGAAFAQAQPKPPEPDWTVTGNATLTSDYRFRGFTQTNYGPAFQGGFDVAHKSGFYLGNWNSNVMSSLYNGGSLEMDLYGGYKGEIASGVGFDVGAIYYFYPRSGKDTVNIPPLFKSTRIDNKELYFGLGWGPLSGKLFVAMDDYFKIASYYGAPQSTRGTTYLDLSYSQDFSGWIVGAHYGLLNLKHNNQAALAQTSDVGATALPKSVADWKLSLGRDVGGFVFTGALVGTTHKGFFGTDLVGLKAAGKTSVVLSVGKTF